MSRNLQNQNISIRSMVGVLKENEIKELVNRGPLQWVAIEGQRHTVVLVADDDHRDIVLTSAIEFSKEDSKDIEIKLVQRDFSTYREALFKNPKIVRIWTETLSHTSFEMGIFIEVEYELVELTANCRGNDKPVELHI